MPIIGLLNPLMKLPQVEPRHTCRIDHRRQEVLIGEEWLAKRRKQAYWVCTLIEESGSAAMPSAEDTLTLITRTALAI